MAHLYGVKISQMRERLGLSQDELGTKAGLSTHIISLIKQGKVCEQSKIKTVIYALERAQSLQGPSHTLAAQPLSEHFKSLEPGHKKQAYEAQRNSALNAQSASLHWAQAPHRDMFGPKDLPVYSLAQGGLAGNTAVEEHAIDWTYRPADLDNVQNAFAMYVTGDSMAPRYCNGDLIYINPQKNVHKGSHVLIELNDHSFFVKRFLRWSENQLEADQYNPQSTLRFPRSLVLRMLAVVGCFQH